MKLATWTLHTLLACIVPLKTTASTTGAASETGSDSAAASTVTATYKSTATVTSTVDSTMALTTTAMVSSTLTTMAKTTAAVISSTVTTTYPIQWLSLIGRKYYINLPPKDNWSRHGALQTEWSKLRIVGTPRINDAAVTIDLHDWTYSTTNDEVGSDQSLKQVEWGVTGDCRGASYASEMRLNLLHTPFRYEADVMQADGLHPHGNVTCGNNNKQCTARCGGRCGYCGFGEPGFTPTAKLYVVDRARYDGALRELLEEALEALRTTTKTTTSTTLSTTMPTSRTRTSTWTSTTQSVAITVTTMPTASSNSPDVLTFLLAGAVAALILGLLCFTHRKLYSKSLTQDRKPFRFFRRRYSQMEEEHPRSRGAPKADRFGRHKSIGASELPSVAEGSEKDDGYESCV